MTSLPQDMLFPRGQLQSITEGVLAVQPRNYSLVGAKFMGKTRILNHLASPDGPLLSNETARRMGVDPVVVYFDCAWPNAKDDLLGFLAEGMRRHFQQTVDYPSLDLEALRGEEDGGERLRRSVNMLKQEGLRPVLLLDNFDVLIEGAGAAMEREINRLRPLTREMVLIVAGERPLHEANRQLASSPLFNLLNQLFLRLIEPQEMDIILRQMTSRCADQAKMTTTLATWTGGHPFLLSRIPEILLDVDEMLPGTDPIGPAHLPLIRLRLTEDYGRLLFSELWSALHAQDDPRAAEGLVLVRRLLTTPLPIAQVQEEAGRAFFWLLNQGIVRIEADNCHLFSPLFAEYVAARAETRSAVSARQIVPLPDAATLAAQTESFTPQERTLLHYFLDRPDQVISIEQLLEDVWRRPNASSRRVQEGIRRLRTRLDTMRIAIGHIENEWGEGYRFVPSGRTNEE